MRYQAAPRPVDRADLGHTIGAARGAPAADRPASPWTLGVSWVLVAATPLALSVFALLDAARRPAWAWSLAERPQAMWMGMILVGTFLSILGIGLSLYYLTRVRPAVAAAENGKISPPRSVTPRVDP